MLAKITNKDTQTVVSALIKHAKKLPSELYKSLTWDRGKELAGRFHGITQSLVEGTPHRSAARQIGKNHTIATAATIDQNAVSKQGSVG